LQVAELQGDAELARQLYALAKERGWVQTQVADELEGTADQTTVSRWWRAIEAEQADPKRPAKIRFRSQATRDAVSRALLQPERPDYARGFDHALTEAEAALAKLRARYRALLGITPPEAVSDRTGDVVEQVRIEDAKPKKSGSQGRRRRRG
jgi:hypothetical protein